MDPAKKFNNAFASCTVPTFSRARSPKSVISSVSFTAVIAQDSAATQQWDSGLGLTRGRVK